MVHAHAREIVSSDLAIARGSRFGRRVPLVVLSLPGTKGFVFFFSLSHRKLVVVPGQADCQSEGLVFARSTSILDRFISH